MTSPRNEANVDGEDRRRTQISQKYDSLPKTFSKFGAFRVNGVGSYGVVRSLKEDVRVVVKKILELDTEQDNLSGCKETAILAHMKNSDAARKYTPRLLNATFRNNVVTSITMTNEGRDLQTLRYAHGIVPCVRTLALHLCEALTFLKKSGVVHNDITPKNVTYSRIDNRFRLVDFGSAEFSRMGAKELGIRILEKSGNDGVGRVSSGLLAKHMPQGTSMHLLDVQPSFNGIRTDRKVTNVPYRDVSHVLGDRKRKTLSDKSDLYGAAMTVATVLANNTPEKFDQFDYQDFDRGNCTEEPLLKVCEHLVRLRGPTTDKELSFWNSYVNSVDKFLDAMRSPNEKTPVLDCFRDVLGRKLVKALKRSLSPVPEYRELSELHAAAAIDNEVSDVDAKHLSLKRAGDRLVHLLYDDGLVIGDVQFGNESERKHIIVVEHVHSMLDDPKTMSSFVTSALRLCKYRAKKIELPAYNVHERQRLESAFGGRAVTSDDGTRLTVAVDDGVPLIMPRDGKDAVATKRSDSYLDSNGSDVSSAKRGRTAPRTDAFLREESSTDDEEYYY